MQRFNRLSRAVSASRPLYTTQRAFYHQNFTFSKNEADKYDAIERNREEEWAYKRDMEAIKKLHEQVQQTQKETNIKVEKHAAEVKKEVKDHLAKSEKESQAQINDLKKKIEELKDLLHKIEKK